VKISPEVAAIWAAVGEPRNSSTFTEPGCEGCELLQTPEGWTMPAPSEVERPATSEPDFSMVSSARINHQDFIQKYSKNVKNF
jgi:hypothetical protein